MHFVLQIHSNNIFGQAGLRDFGGFRVYYNTIMRPKISQVIYLGLGSNPSYVFDRSSQSSRITVHHSPRRSLTPHHAARLSSRRLLLTRAHSDHSHRSLPPHQPPSPNYSVPHPSTHITHEPARTHSLLCIVAFFAPIAVAGQGKWATRRKSSSYTFTLRFGCSFGVP